MKCSKCKQDLPAAAFTKNQRYCKACRRDYHCRSGISRKTRASLPYDLKMDLWRKSVVRRPSYEREPQGPRIDVANINLLRSIFPKSGRAYKRDEREARTVEKRAEFRRYRLDKARYERLNDTPIPFGREMRVSSFTEAQVRATVERDKHCVYCPPPFPREVEDSMEKFRIKDKRIPPLHVVAAIAPPLAGGWRPQDLILLCAPHYHLSRPSPNDRKLRQKLGVPCLIDPAEILQGVTQYIDQPFQERCKK